MQGVFMENRIFDREKYRRKLNTIVEYELKMGIVRSKAEFARKYKVSQQLLNSYLKDGNLNVSFAGRICNQLNISSDYLIYDERPNQRPPIQFIPPIILPSPDPE